MSIQATPVWRLTRIRRANLLSALVVSLMVAGGVMTAHVLLTCVEDGHSALLTFPFDAGFRVMEQGDARQTAEDYYALSRVVAGIGLLMAVMLIWRIDFRPELEFLCRSTWFWILLLAMVADLGTTVWFMHERGIELELHPGLRLLTYAFGRTAGPVIGKGLQFSGIALFGMQSHRWWPWLAGMSAALAMLAAIHNGLQML